MKFEATAIVLAGGKSSRMNGKDKSLLPIGDITMIEHIIKQLENYFSEIIIGANDIKKYSFLKKKIVPDIEKNQGPLMGIYSCLKTSSNQINFITACDTPEINIEFVKQLLIYSNDYEVVIPFSDEDKYEPLFAIYQKKIIPKIEKSLKEGNLKIINILKTTDNFFLKFENKKWYKNINSEKDYINYIMP